MNDRSVNSPGKTTRVRRTSNSANKPVLTNEFNSETESLIQSVHLGPTLGLIGILCSVFLLPVIASTIMWFLDAAELIDVSSWIICSPVFVGGLVFLIISSVTRYDVQLLLRISWAVVLVGICAFLAILCIEIEGTRSMQFILDWVTTTTPHWIIAFVILVCGIIQLIVVDGRCRGCGKSSRACCSTMCCCGCCGLCLQPSDPEYGLLLNKMEFSFVNEQKENRRLSNITTGVLQIFVGVLWGVTAILAYYGSNKAFAPVPWKLVFVPWWAYDCVIFILFAALLFFSFGAMDSSVLTISQQCLILIIVTSCAGFKCLMALYLQTAGFGVPKPILLGSALLLEISIAALGFSFARSRNSGLIVFGGFLGEDIKSVKEQLTKSSFRPDGSVNVSIQSGPRRPVMGGSLGSYSSSSGNLTSNGSGRHLKQNRRNNRSSSPSGSKRHLGNGSLRRSQRASSSSSNLASLSSSSDSLAYTSAEP